MTLDEMRSIATAWKTPERVVAIAIGATVQLLAPNPNRLFWRIVPFTIASIRIAQDPTILPAGGITIANGTEGFPSKFFDDPGSTTAAWYGFQSTVGSLNVIVYECIPVGQNKI